MWSLDVMSNDSANTFIDSSIDMFGRVVIIDLFIYCDIQTMDGLFNVSVALLVMLLDVSVCCWFWDLQGDM